MSNEVLKQEPDYRFFGPVFHEQMAEYPIVMQMVRDVGALADELMTAHGVQRFEDLPPEAVDDFEDKILRQSWPLGFGEDQNE